MTEVSTIHTAPKTIPSAGLRVEPPKSVLLPASVQTLQRSGNLTLDTFSPVNQNGSFEFDRVLKSGEVLKRTRKTKAWRPIYLVLRPNLLSTYRDKNETKLRHQINLSELTAIARQKDPKRKAKHVFGLFSPSRNYHLEAPSDKEAQEWVELIRREARIDEEEEEMTLASPGGAKSAYNGFERHKHAGIQAAMDDRSGGYSSSDAEPLSNHPAPRPRDRAGTNYSARRPSHTMDYSGPEYGSYSDFSDSAGPAARMSALSLSYPDARASTSSAGPPQVHSVYGAIPQRPSMARNPSQISQLGQIQDENRTAAKQKEEDGERVVSHGWIYLLKTKSGVRQWKRLWMVLRPKSLALYKNEEEYTAVLILPFPSIINAVEIDPISRSKRFCFQIISEERNYRFCAPDEDSLARWLGALKSLLARRKAAAVS